MKILKQDFFKGAFKYLPEPHNIWKRKFSLKKYEYPAETKVHVR